MATRKGLLAILNVCLWIAIGWRWPFWVRLVIQPLGAALIAYCIAHFRSFAEFRRYAWSGFYLATHRHCDHASASVSDWIASDGTPMVTIFCPGCGWRDQGPVIR